MKLDMVREGHLGGFIRGGDPATWCPTLWQWAVQRWQAKSVIDVGCGEGHSTQFFQQLGCQALGVDGSATAIDNTVAPGAVELHDFCAGPFRTNRSFDIAWSCEFLEHVEARYVPGILATFDLAKKAVLLTHAFPGQEDGHHHVNCRPSSYWIRQLESLGFHCSIEATLEARRIALADYPGINHFARSGLVFERKPGLKPTPRSALSAWLADRRINWGFRLSSEYRTQRSQRRAQKRLAARQRLDTGHSGS